MKPATINLAVWAALTLMVALLGSVAAWGRSSITRHATPIPAKVTQLFPHNHLSFEYTYTVAGTSYSGTATAASANRDFSRLKIGDTVSVFYDSTNPSTSTVGPRDMPAIQSIGNLIAACAIIPLVIMLLLHHMEALPRWAPFDAARPTNPGANA